MAECACPVIEWNTALRPWRVTATAGWAKELLVLTTEPWTPRPVSLHSGGQSRALGLTSNPLALPLWQCSTIGQPQLLYWSGL